MLSGNIYTANAAHCVGQGLAGACFAAELLRVAVFWGRSAGGAWDGIRRALRMWYRSIFYLSSSGIAYLHSVPNQRFRLGVTVSII